MIDESFLRFSGTLKQCAALDSRVWSYCARRVELKTRRVSVRAVGTERQSYLPAS